MNLVHTHRKYKYETTRRWGSLAAILEAAYHRQVHIQIYNIDDNNNFSYTC